MALWSPEKALKYRGETVARVGRCRVVLRHGKFYVRWWSPRSKDSTSTDKSIRRQPCRGPFAALEDARQQAEIINADFNKIFLKNTCEKGDKPAPNIENIERTTIDKDVPELNTQPARRRRENPDESALDPVFAAFLTAAQPRLSASAWNQLRALLGHVEVWRINHDRHD